MGKIVGVTKKPRRGKKDGKLYWHIYWTPCRGSRKIYRWVQADTRSDASDIRQDLMAEYKGKGNDAGLPTDFYKALEELERTMRGDGRPTKTIKLYQGTFKRVFEDFKNLYEAKHKKQIASLLQLDSSYFHEYKDWFVLDLGRTRGWRDELIRIKAILSKLRMKKLCRRELLYDVREELPTPSSNTVPYHDIPDSILDKLLAYIKKDRYDYYKPILYMYLTGRRPRETTLYLKDDVVGGVVDPRELRIRREITKTKRDSVIYLQGKLKDLIMDTLRNNRTKWLFPNRHGRRCSVDKLYQYLKKTSKEVIGIELTPKYFRKRFHTKMIPISMKDAMSISGLKDVRVAMEHYDYTTPYGQGKILAEKGKRAGRKKNERASECKSKKACIGSAGRVK